MKRLPVPFPFPGNLSFSGTFSFLLARLFVTHTRPEPVLGVLGPLHTGPRTSGLGYVNQGGTLSTPGMLFVNCSS